MHFIIYGNLSTFAPLPVCDSDYHCCRLVPLTMHVTKLVSLLSQKSLTLICGMVIIYGRNHVCIKYWNKHVLTLFIFYQKLNL
jgi:hypothetical protein